MVVQTHELIDLARRWVHPINLGRRGDAAATVACALVTEAGNVYTGVCIDLSCGIGTCAEHAAVAEMIKHRETVIKTIVAVTLESVLPPCGRCRELLVQVDPANFQTEVILPENEVRPLTELLPQHWMAWYTKDRPSRHNGSETTRL